jgi:hypothetical protein
VDTATERDSGFEVLGPPPRIEPVRADLFRGPIFGRPVILDTAEGYFYDWRAVSEVLHDLDGDHVIVVPNDRFYGWLVQDEGLRGPRPRRGTSFPAAAVYVER